MAIKTMTLDEVRKLPPLTAEEVEDIKNFDEKFEDPDCPPATDKQLSQAKSLYEVHPEWFKPKKVDVHIKLDVDVLEALKASGKGYQTRINAILRQAVCL